MAVYVGVKTKNLLQFINNSTSKPNIYSLLIYGNACARHCPNFRTQSRQFQRRSKRVEDQSNAEFMANESKKYEMGKRWLAKMMGVDVETFTEKDIEESLRYLLPTKLFAKDARPVMKHPTQIFPESKSTLDSENRPVHPAFYTGATGFHDLLYDIFQCRKQSGLKQDSRTADSSSAENNEKKGDTTLHGKDIENSRKLRWLNHVEMQTILKEELTSKDYQVIIHRLKRLAGEKSFDNSQEVEAFCNKFRTSVINEASQFTAEQLDEKGQAHGRGYRKRAMAEVWIKNGNGHITINDIPLIEYFTKQEDRNQVWHPFITLRCLGKYDAECNVIGGGTTGQAGAIRLALSRALTSLSSNYLAPLHTAGLLTRDRRLVERKKPGQKKARKKFAWVKR